MMRRDGNIAFCLFLCYAQFLFVSLLEQFAYDTFTRIKFLDNRISNDTRPIIRTDSFSHCALTCSERDDCISFFYMTNVRSCRCKLMNHIIENDLFMESENGWKYFIQDEHSTIYEVTVKTGNIRYAGTDANVFIQLYGISGIFTKTIDMDDAGNNFERAYIKKFKLVDVDVGPLAYIVVGHDNSGYQPGWFLDYIRVKRSIDENEFTTHMATATSSLRKPKYEEYFFPCNRWFARNKGDGLIIRNLTFNSTHIIFE